MIFAPPIRFLGSSLTFMLVYVWSKRNRDVQMRFMQMFNFTAPYLPWVLLAFSVLLHNNAVVDLMGIGAGHLYFFLEDVYPQLQGGRRVLITPTIMCVHFCFQFSLSHMRCSVTLLWYIPRALLYLAHSHLLSATLNWVLSLSLSHTHTICCIRTALCVI